MILIKTATYFNETTTKSIYIISPDIIPKGEYKIGKHTGSERKLLRLYEGYFVNPKIILFERTEYAHEIKQLVKGGLAENRIPNYNGNLSEWFVMDLEKFKDIVHTSVENYDPHYDHDPIEFVKKICNRIP